MNLVRAVDGGGNGFRRADVYDERHTCNFKTASSHLISSPERLLSFVLGGFSKSIVGVSYAMAGEIKNGVVVKSPQIHMLDGIDLARITTKITKRPTLVVNDMDGALIGMKVFLPNRNYFMGITWSSGIGLRIFRNGEILASGEGGHIPLDHSPFAPLCGCGLRGCAESICGGESIKRRVIAETQALGIKIPDNVHPCLFLDASYNCGEKWAKELYQLIAMAMGSFLAVYQSIFRLPLVVWKGGFALRFLRERLGIGGEQLVRRYLRQRLINPNWEREMNFEFSFDPGKDSLIGAAALFNQIYR